MRFADIKMIADSFGYHNQKNMLIEEMAELTQALCKYDRANMVERTAALSHVYEEMADVILVLAQIEYLLDAEDAINEIVNQKIERTKQRYFKKKS